MHPPRLLRASGCTLCGGKPHSVTQLVNGCGEPVHDHIAGDGLVRGSNVRPVGGREWWWGNTRGRGVNGRLGTRVQLSALFTTAVSSLEPPSNPHLVGTLRLELWNLWLSSASLSLSTLLAKSTSISSSSSLMWCSRACCLLVVAVRCVAGWWTGVCVKQGD